MEHFTMIATGEGRWVLPDSEEFLSALGDFSPDYDAAAFAVRNLGFIRFQILDRLVIEIELHPRNVASPALMAVQEQLRKSAIKLFRIKYLDTEWRSEISSSAEHTIARLAELCAPSFTPTATARFKAIAKPASILLDDKTNALLPLVQKWRASFGQFDDSVISFAINHEFLSRMVIVGVKSDLSDAVFRFVGNRNATWLEEDRHLDVIGEKLESMPDKEYGGWVAQFYKSVANSKEPRYDHIAASIRRRPKPYRTHYERLLLPWTRSSSETLVTVLSNRLSDKASASADSEPESSVARNSAKSS